MNQSDGADMNAPLFVPRSVLCQEDSTNVCKHKRRQLSRCILLITKSLACPAIVIMIKIILHSSGYTLLFTFDCNFPLRTLKF